MRRTSMLAVGDTSGDVEAMPGTHPRLKSQLVCVVGGGIGGLAVALALQQDGACVQVFERDAAFDDRKQGYGLTLTHNDKGPLAHLGLLDHVKQHDAASSPSNRHWIFHADGSLIGYYGNDFATTAAATTTASSSSSSSSAWQRGNLRIPRQELRKALLERLRPGTVHWGRRLSHIAPSSSIVEENTGEEKIHCEGGSSHAGVVSASDSGGGGKKGKSGGQQNADSSSSMELVFENGSRSPPCALVVGCDGIRSKVRDLIEPNVNPPSYTGVFIALGLSPLRHPLVESGGFYTYDGTHRIFTMPYSKDLTMWQLSFPLPSLDAAKHLASSSVAAAAAAAAASSSLSACSTGAGEGVVDGGETTAAAAAAASLSCNSSSSSSSSGGISSGSNNNNLVLEEVLRRVECFHEPVPSLLRASLESWGTPLFDRLVDDTGDQKSKDASSSRCCLPGHATLLGDAAHPMTPFKGQGANQALADAVRLSSWLLKAPLPTALKNYEREMAAASGAKVRASRAAAKFLHSPPVLVMENQHQQQQQQPYATAAVSDNIAAAVATAAVTTATVLSTVTSTNSPANEVLRFAGVSAEYAPRFIQRLREARIGARTSKEKEGCRSDGNDCRSNNDGIGQNGNGDTVDASNGGGRGLMGGGALAAAVAAEIAAFEAELGASVREDKAVRRKKRGNAGAVSSSAAAAAQVKVAEDCRASEVVLKDGTQHLPVVSSESFGSNNFGAPAKRAKAN